ncbi:MAG: ABC transporter ATP-binding protein [Oscillospiraceae bacterium]|nr:ABC transporter ATP-binding protein [Oscillospiraceae bacterium]
MINIKDFSLSFGQEKIIDSFSLHLDKGEKIALMGPSGCGKTSLLRAIAGLIKPQEGSISLGGTVSCIFQEPRLLPWLSAAENVNAVLSDSIATMAEAQKWLEAVGLGDSGDKLPSQLSGGMQQRVSIARALAYGGDILLLDEPMKAMDADTADAVAKLIMEHAKDKTLIIVTHDEAEAKAFADKIYLYGNKSFHPL